MRQDCEYYDPIIREFILDVNDYGFPILDYELEGEICLLSCKSEDCEDCDEYSKRVVVISELIDLPF